jgi:hypothetical protein
MRRAILAISILALSCGFALAYGEGQLLQEMQIVDEEIASVDETLKAFDGGAIVAVAKMRKEVLLLTKAAIRARLLAADDPERTEVVIPTFVPDEATAAAAAADFALSAERVAAAEADAADAGGLARVLAYMRVETEKMNASQLFMAYVSAKYGVAFPAAPAESGATASAPKSSEVGAISDDTPTKPEVPEWADPDHPEIDYTQQRFKVMSGAGQTMIGTWGIKTTRAEIDDSLHVVAVASPDDYDGSLLIVQCRENEVAVVYKVDDFVMTGFSEDTFRVDVRMDDAPATRESWGKLTSNHGAGLFGSKGERAMRKLVGTSRLFMRLTEGRGETHDATFNLVDTEKALSKVADACGISLLDLSSAEIKGVQSLLNAGGFDTGRPDGQWGEGSKRAMRAFQASVGLPQTGAINSETLSKLGFER